MPPSNRHPIPVKQELIQTFKKKEDKTDPDFLAMALFGIDLPDLTFDVEEL